MARAHARTAHPGTRRRIAAGELVGSCEPDGTFAWRGIRYAAAPAGDLRWRAPQPVTPWSGVVEALTHGEIAPQYAGLLAPVPPRLHGTVIGNEDCLTLNIFAPGEAPTARHRPVMVWIHGGANAAGTSATYDVARNYAAHDGIVVVSLNYRLGVLGWFCHPALIEADQATPEERSGNFGTLDLIAALRRVRKNIAAFGGDPDCVTIFGESAGAQNVLTLLASPLAAGLFHRAIAQSPVVDTFDVCEATERNNSPLESFRTSSREIAARLWVAAVREADVDAADGSLQTHASGRSRRVSTLAVAGATARGIQSRYRRNVSHPASHSRRHRPAETAASRPLQVGCMESRARHPRQQPRRISGLHRRQAGVSLWMRTSLVRKNYVLTRLSTSHIAHWPDYIETCATDVPDTFDAGVLVRVGGEEQQGALLLLSLSRPIKQIATALC